MILYSILLYALPSSASSEEICAMMGRRCLHSAPLQFSDTSVPAQGESTSGTNMDSLKLEILVGVLMAL